MRIDLLVRVGNPQALDATLRQLGDCAVLEEKVDDCSVVRIFDVGQAEFIRFAIHRQGYAEVVRWRSVHPSLTGVQTGRMSCKYPNKSNLPKSMSAAAAAEAVPDED